jgi:hypothetical protein
MHCNQMFRYISRLCFITSLFYYYYHLCVNVMIVFIFITIPFFFLLCSKMYLNFCNRNDDDHHWNWLLVKSGVFCCCCIYIIRITINKRLTNLIRMFAYDQLKLLVLSGITLLVGPWLYRKLVASQRNCFVCVLCVKGKRITIRLLATEKQNI